MQTLSKLRAYQFSILQLAAAAVVAAFLALSYVEFGGLPLLALGVAVLVGPISGGAIGVFHREIVRGVLGGLGGSVLSAVVVATWWEVEIAKHGEIARFRLAPVTAFFHPEVLLSLGLGAALGSIPVAAIAAVHDRRAGQIVVRVILTCVLATIAGGLAFFSYDLWSRWGKLQGLPLPYPILAAIPLSMAICAATLIGLISSGLWLIIRELLFATRRGQSKWH